MPDALPPFKPRSNSKPSPSRQISDDLSRRGDLEKLAGVALRRVSHLYHKTDAVYAAMRKMAAAQMAAQTAGARLSTGFEMNRNGFEKCRRGLAFASRALVHPRCCMGLAV